MSKRTERRAFVLRMWRDETGQIQGQMSEPASGQRVPFAGADDLWQLLLACLDAPPPETRPPDPPDG